MSSKREIGLASASSLRREPSNDVLSGVTMPSSSQLPSKGEQHSQQARRPPDKDQDQASSSHGAAPKAEVHPYRAELSRLFELAAPLFVQNIFAFCLPLVSAAFVGHLASPTALSSLVLANSLYNVSGFSVVVGISAGMETLCGQAHGAKHYKMLGIVLQRALLICFLLCIPIMVLWYYAETLLTAIGQPAAVVAGASEYLWLISPTIFLTALCECIRRYLMAQRVVLPSTVAYITVALLAPLYNWLLVFRFNYGLAGAAYAFVLCMATQAAFLVGYTVWRERSMRRLPERCFDGWTIQAFKDWPLYLSYGAPAAAMICAEWWVYESVIFMSGLLPNAEVAVGVMGVAFQFSAMAFNMSLAFGMSVNTRVANELGAGHARMAMNAFRMGLVLVLLFQGTVSILFGLLGKFLIRGLTNSDDVATLMHSLIPIIAISFVGDGLNCVLQATLRGAGRQVLGAAMNLVGYWGLGVPLAWLLAFHFHLGVLGLWIGLATATSLQAIMQVLVVGSISWDNEVLRSQQLQQAHGFHVLPSSEAAADAVGQGGMLGAPAAATGAAMVQRHSMDVDQNEDEERPLLDAGRSLPMSVPHARDQEQV